MSEQETVADHCLATGDMPVRNVPRLAFLVDGRMTMLEMCLAFLRARYSIYITAWGLSPELLLVRGKHKCAGSPDSHQQEALLQWLRAKGLSPRAVKPLSSDTGIEGAFLVWGLGTGVP